MSKERRVCLDSEVASSELAEWVALKSPEQPTKKASGWDEAHARRVVTEMIEKQDWHSASPKHFVELYVHLHTRVYGVAPLDLDNNRKKLTAASLARKVMKEHFDNTPDEMANFMRWVWQRQQVNEKKRKAGIVDSDFMVSWRYQFSASLVKQYRRDMMVKGGR